MYSCHQSVKYDTLHFPRLFSENLRYANHHLFASALTGATIVATVVVGPSEFFAADGLVSETERGERWLFWSMGISDPGVMRRWGTQAIAFVGRRHFDGPYLGLVKK